VFIAASNQQSDQGIARALQFCDSGFRREVEATSRSVTCLSREHRKEDHDQPRRGRIMSAPAQGPGITSGIETPPRGAPSGVAVLSRSL
jgi:hypothetical protein